jgi:translocation and assembly module TamA
LRGSSDSLASDTSFLQFKATTKWIWSLSEKTRMIARGKFGATLKDELSELPVSVRFFTGGDHSVRGYDFESLGPVDENGAVIGGSHLLEASIEFDRMIVGNWSIAAFVDTGSAFSDFSPEFSTGVGLGIRWYSPIGPIRIDFAHPLDDPDRDFRLHLTLGPDL